MGTLEHLTIFAESGVQIGTGHVMRCLAFAQAWRRAGGTVTFVVPYDSAGVTERIRREGLSLDVLPEGRDLRDVLIRTDTKLAVLDGYGFGSSEQASLSDSGVGLLFLDDYGHADHYSARWVLNPNPCARPQMYSHRDPDTRLLLGSPYALLRNEFLPRTGWKRSFPERARNILITMGGSDSGNASSKILQGIAQLKKYETEVVLVVGSGNPHLKELRRIAEECPVSVRVVENAQDMPALMAWADIAIAAAGGTSYELCFMGLPSLLFVAAPNQRGVAESLHQLGAAAPGGTAQDLNQQDLVEEIEALLGSPERRREMSQKGRQLIDGLGAERVRAAVMGRELRLRVLQESDCQLLFVWANDPTTREVSFHPAHISWEEHSRWFAQRLEDPESVVYIGENIEGTAVGQVRFQVQSEKAVLSVSVAPEFRGKGWGADLIFFATRSLARERFVNTVDALVKPSNSVSVHLFEKSGFRYIAAETVAGQTASRFSWNCGTGTYVS